MDAGEHHIGISIKTEKSELISEQRDLLSDEKEHHDDQRKYRRSRRNRIRYRKPRFDNRNKTKGWFAPSIENKKNQHIRCFKRHFDRMPISDAYIEVGQFDTQVLEAVESGKQIPEGKDYQHGPTYGYDTLREAVFARDDYTCICCGSTIGKVCAGKDSNGKPVYKSGDVILRMHHLGFKNHDRSNRMSNLATVCLKCHTPVNHKPGGKLYDLEPKLKTFSGASFMNTVKYSIYKGISELSPNTHLTYGAVTKRTRLNLNISKSHPNDAFCIGRFHPKRRVQTDHWIKVRRNNRCLEKFYDAKVVDIRTGEVVKGSQLGCERTNRSTPRNNSDNLRMYRGKKTSKGYRSIRTKRYSIRPGDIVLYQGVKYPAIGIHNNGKSLQLDNVKQYDLKNVQIPTDKKGKPKVLVKGLKISVPSAKRNGKYVKCKVVSCAEDEVFVSYPFDVKPDAVTIDKFVRGWQKFS